MNDAHTKKTKLTLESCLSLQVHQLFWVSPFSAALINSIPALSTKNANWSIFDKDLNKDLQ